MDADFNDSRNDAGQPQSSSTGPQYGQQYPQYDSGSPSQYNPQQNSPYGQTGAGQTGVSGNSSQSDPYASNPYMGGAGQYPPAGAPVGSQTPYDGVPYGAPQYGQPYGQYQQAGAYYQPQGPYYAPTEQWNTLAIVGFVLAFVFAPAGLIVSIIALRQINRTHERGKGLAIAGIVLGAICVVFIVIMIVLVVAVMTMALNDPSGWSTSYCVGSDCYDYGGFDDFEDVALRQVATIRAIPNPLAWLRG